MQEGLKVGLYLKNGCKLEYDFAVLKQIGGLIQFTLFFTSAQLSN